MAAVHVSGESLNRYLDHAARKPWEWGVCDCLLFCADWIYEATGRDPAQEYRGAYHDERSARRLMKAEGGIEALSERLLASAGLSVIGQPQRGDVGLVRVPIKEWRGRAVTVPAGAICLGAGLWAIKTRDVDTITAARLPLIRAWRLPWPTQ